MVTKMKLSEKLVFKDLECRNKEEVLDFLATQLYEAGYVKEAYIEAIKEREAEYPTGLPSSPPGIAIPHANYDLVKETTLAIATLKEPVYFNNMENNQEETSVQIVIMMAISEPHGQIEMLQKIVAIIQDEPLRQQMINSVDSDTLLALVQQAVL